MTAKKEGSVTALRKLTSLTIMGEKTRRPATKEEYLYRITGTITGIKTGETQFGPWVGFKGNFVARRHDGTLFAAPSAFIPQPMQDMFEAAILTQEAEGLVASVQFGLDVSIIQADSSVGFEYKCVPVIEMASEGQSLLDSTLEKTPVPKLPSPKAASK